MKGWIALIISICSFAATAQTKMLYPGFSVAASMVVGTHVRQVGVKIGAYVQTGPIQMNIGSSYHFNARNLGERRSFSEARTYLGTALLFGKKERTMDLEFDGLTHQTTSNGAFAYNYLWYHDSKGTSQNSGGFGIGWKHSYLRFENDIFAGQGKDRFRTGCITYSYQIQNSKFSAGLLLWTGETKGSTWFKEPKSKVPNGYRDLSQLPFGTTSHGILFLSATGYLDYGQTISFKTGIESEQIRHLSQNRLLHDLVFLPKFIKRHTPHYPRLNEKGQPIFTSSERKKDRIYMQLGFGSNWSY